LTPLRAVLLYLFALNATLSAIVAWDDRVATSPTLLPLWALALAAALGLGERLEPSFATIDAERRTQMAVFLGSLLLCILIVCVTVAAIRPSPGLLRFLVSIFSGCFLPVLALVRLTPHPRAALAHGFSLSTLAALEGGSTAAWAILSSFVLATLFIGVDHHARLLSAGRVDPRHQGGIALTRSAAVMLPVALGLAAFLAFAGRPRDPDPAAGPEARMRSDPKLEQAALRATIVAAIVGTGAVYVVGRLLIRRSRTGEAERLQPVEPLRGEVRRLSPPIGQPATVPVHAGRRGRIARAYLRLLAGAARAGFARHPHETPHEFAIALGQPQAALEAVTEQFVRARYGPLEPSEEDAEGAERQAEIVLDHFRRRRPTPRPAAVVEADRTPGKRPTSS